MSTNFDIIRDSTEERIRQRAHDVADRLRQAAEVIDHIADRTEVAHIPSSVTSEVMNMMPNLRLDSATAWLGELLILERSQNKEKS